MISVASVRGAMVTRRIIIRVLLTPYTVLADIRCARSKSQGCEAYGRVEVKF
jgi:hypothetical protein